MAGADPLLTDLAAEVKAIATSTEMQKRRELWVRHFNCEAQGKIPVKCAMFIDTDDVVWARLLPREQRTYREGLRARLELSLRQRIFKFRHIPDDDVIEPVLWLWATCSAGEPHPWGVPVELNKPDEPLGAYKPKVALETEADLDHLCYPVFSMQADANARLVEQALELTGGQLEIKLRTDQLHYGPWEWAVRLRGMDNLLYDVIDRPDFVHRLMEHITTGLVSYHQQREAAGAYDAASSLGLHQPYDLIPPELQHKLAGGWVYCHAQSAVLLSPAMYAEFVQPYNARIAALFRRVYYHGCEDLSKKATVIRELPNLRHFHVSPWTDPATVVTALAGYPVVFEVHSHPTHVLFVYDAAAIRREIRDLKARAQGALFDLKLCDIQTIDGAEGKLQLWAQIAQEESAL